MGKRTWTLEQRRKHSQKRRRSTEIVVSTLKGNKHYELVQHPRACNLLESILAYEAAMNNVTLEEWIRRHRITGVLTGHELYLPPSTFVIALDNDVNNVEPDNLYCFLDRKSRLQSKYETDFPVNSDEVLQVAKDYTKKVRK